jgi:hypothetical protein
MMAFRPAIPLSGHHAVRLASLQSFNLSGLLGVSPDPVMEYSDCSFGVALSNHADFSGTLEYIRATKAKYVVTDNTRGHAAELAQEVTRRLQIPARPSTTAYSREWGVS